MKSDQDGKFQGDSQERLGEKAEVFYTPRAAIACFTRALEAAQHLSMAPPAKLYRARGHAYEMVDEFERARDDYEQALHTARTACDGLAEWQSLIDLGFLWLGRDYQRAGDYFRSALEGVTSMSRTEQVSVEQIAEQRDALVGWLFQATLGMMDILSIYLGDRLGLYQGLSVTSWATAAELAALTGTEERYVREWLEQQAITGILEVKDASASALARHYRLPPGHAEVFLDRDSLNYLVLPIEHDFWRFYRLIA